AGVVNPSELRFTSRTPAGTSVTYKCPASDARPHGNISTRVARAGPPTPPATVEITPAGPACNTRAPWPGCAAARPAAAAAGPAPAAAAAAALSASIPPPRALLPMIPPRRPPRPSRLRYLPAAPPPPAPPPPGREPRRPASLMTTPLPRCLGRGHAVKVVSRFRQASTNESVGYRQAPVAPPGRWPLRPGRSGCASARGPPPSRLMTVKLTGKR